MSDFKKKMEDKYTVPDKISPENMVKLINENKASKKRKKIRLISGITSLAACFAIIIGISANTNNGITDSGENNKKPENNFVSEMENNPSVNGVVNLQSNKNTLSYKEIYNILSKINDREYLYLYQSGVDFDDEEADLSTPPVHNESIQEAPSTSPNGDNDANRDEFSETYQQVEGVAEADVIKTDGKFIYYLSGDCIYVINLKGDILSKTQVINTSEYMVSEMFLVENKLVYMYSDKKDNNNICSAEIYQINDKGELNKENFFTQDGAYITSRMINNKLYIISY